MGKLGDLWVRLGLKSDDYKKGIDKAKKETQGFGSTLSKMKTGALAVWAVIGASVMKFAKDFVTHSQTIGDKWNQMTGQMHTVWSQFLTSLTNWDWEGFGQRVRNAMDATSKSISAHDAEYEVMNSIKMRKAAMAEELAQLQILMRDTRKSYDERAQAAQQYLDKVRPLYEEEIKLRKRQYLADTAEYLAGAGVGVNADNTDLLRKFFTNIAPDEKLMRQLVEYQKKNLGQQYELSKSDLADIDKFYEQYGMKAAATLTTIASYYQSTNDDVANKVINAIVAYDQSLAAMNEETRRIQNVQNSALAMTGGGVSMPVVDGWSADSLDKIKSAHEIAFKTGQQIAEDLRTLQAEFSEIEDLDIDMSDVENEMDAFLESWKYDVERVAEMNRMLGDSVVAGITNGIQAITDAMFQIEGADWKSVLAAFIAPLGDTLKQMGAMIVAEGVAMEAFKKSFSNPYAAIAAGTALIAIGSMVSSGLQRLTQNPGGGGSGSAMSYGGSSGSAASLNYESTLTVEVVGKISGNDIVLSGKKTNDKLGR